MPAGQPFSLGDLIFRAMDGASREWSVSTFGTGVNLDVDDHHVLDLELMRRGVRKRGIFCPISGSVANPVHPNRHSHHD